MGVPQYTASTQMTPTCLNKKIGKYVNPTGYTNVDSSCDVFKECGAVLFKLRKNTLSTSVTTTSFELLKSAAGVTRNRCVAAGPKEYVFSRPVGVTEAGVTAWTRNNATKWKACRDLLTAIDGVYKKLAPKEYVAQRRAVRNKSSLVHGTVFSTVTVNRKFRTAMHTDSNNYSGGLAVMTLLKGSTSTGGKLLFPKYKLSVELNEGDVIVYDVNEHHCNSAVRGDRLSCVFYLRQGLCL